MNSHKEARQTGLVRFNQSALQATDNGDVTSEKQGVRTIARAGQQEVQITFQSDNCKTRRKNIAKAQALSTSKSNSPFVHRLRVHKNRVAPCIGDIYTRAFINFESDVHRTKQKGLTTLSCV